MLPHIADFANLVGGHALRLPAAASRLMKRTDVKLMRRWLFCEINPEVTGEMPWTVDQD